MIRVRDYVKEDQLKSIGISGTRYKYEVSPMSGVPPSEDNCFNRGAKYVCSGWTWFGGTFCWFPALTTSLYKMTSTMHTWNSCMHGSETGTVTDCGSKEEAIAYTSLWSLAFTGLVCIPICFFAIWCIGIKKEENEAKEASEKKTLLDNQKV